jgi:dephospho-CoA kinase
MIIGITGTTGAGKDTLAQYLVGKSFLHFSLSDMIRDEARKRGIELTRRNLQDLGNEMRRAHGLGVFSKIALGKIKKGGNYIITSIRNPGEAKVLAQNQEFVLWAVDAPQKERFLRMINRRERDEKEPLTLEEFKKSEAREIESSDKSSQQLAECIKMANFIIINDSDLASFFKKTDELLHYAGIDFGGGQVLPK